MARGAGRPKSGSPLTIRPARIQDAKAIAAIYNEAVRLTTATFDTEPRSLADQVSWLERHDAKYPVLVAELEGAVAGWAALSPWSERCAYAGTAELSIYIGETWRNRGIGRTLLKELIAVGRFLGLHSILARVAEGNPVSQRLHRSEGFATVGIMREVGYKFGRFLDVELMQLILA
ncbi:MAG TPA: GNAT family N-acetyltransferase [Thermoplasmata archaeon]|nr:GNAT family N-acetyltransferase [Thermoplasmata archaeon]